MPDIDIGKHILMCREMAGFSQSELAARCKLQPSAISHFETGRRVPCANNLRKLCIALGVSADILLGTRNVQGNPNA